MKAPHILYRLIIFFFTVVCSWDLALAAQSTTRIIYTHNMHIFSEFGQYGGIACGRVLQKMQAILFEKQRDLETQCTKVTPRYKIMSLHTREPEIRIIFAPLQVLCEPRGLRDMQIMSQLQSCIKSPSPICRSPQYLKAVEVLPRTIFEPLDLSACK